MPIFHPGMNSSQDEISSRQKRVNSKRYFNIDRKDFIAGRVSSWDEISRVERQGWNFIPGWKKKKRKKKKTCKHFILRWNFKMNMFFLFLTYVFKYVLQIQHVWAQWKYEYNETYGLFIKSQARREKKRMSTTSKKSKM